MLMRYYYKNKPKLMIDIVTKYGSIDNMDEMLPLSRKYLYKMLGANYCSFRTASAMCKLLDANWQDYFVAVETATGKRWEAVSSELR